MAASSAPPCGTAVLTVDTRLTLRHCRATHELINVTMAHPNRLLRAHTPWEINDIKLYIMLSLKIYRLMNPNTFSTNGNFCNSVNLLCIMENYWMFRHYKSTVENAGLNNAWLSNSWPKFGQWPTGFVGYELSNILKYFNLFKYYFLYSCAAADKISSDVERHTIRLRQLSLLYTVSHKK